MLGGSESFQEGKYNRTPVGDMLPVYVDGPLATLEMPTNNLRISLTTRGLAAALGAIAGERIGRSVVVYRMSRRSAS